MMIAIKPLWPFTAEKNTGGYKMIQSNTDNEKQVGSIMASSERRQDSRRTVTPSELWQLLNYALNSHERRASWGRREEDFPIWH